MKSVWMSGGGVGGVVVCVCVCLCVCVCVCVWGGGVGSGVLHIMAFARRFRPKEVPVSGFRCMKGHGFHQLKYMKA